MPSVLVTFRLIVSQYCPVNLKGQFNYTLTTTGCGNLNSGNSRCGHEFGTQLSPDEKKALLEYLKTL
jgi:hypothetical protein